MDNIYTDFFRYDAKEDIDKFVNIPTQTWISLGEQKALENFHQAAQAVPAYKDFLKKRSIKPNKVKSIDDFKEVPLVTKENYFKHYPLSALVMKGGLTHSTVIHYSSGSSGQSLFWPKIGIQDLAGFKGMELAYRLYFDLVQTNTLFINCYGMGPWTAGEVVQAATKTMSQKGLKISIISPGTNPDLFFDIFRGLVGNFEQVIIGGYASFLRDLIQEGVKKGIDFKKYNVKLFSGGEKYSENWRNFMDKHLDFKKPYKSVSSVLGMSEVGVAAVSTPFVDYLRMYLYKNKTLAEKIFTREDLPSLLQYIPPARYMEIVEGNIVITAAGNIPVIRYDTKDGGQLFTPQTFMSILPDSFISEYKALKEETGIPNLPIVAVDGRSDKVIILFGANIYPEQITYATEHPSLEKYLTGRFLAKKLETEDADVCFKLILEVKKDVIPTDNMKNKITTNIVKCLIKINSEYANTIKSLGSKAWPSLEFRAYQLNEFMAGSGKCRI